MGRRPGCRRWALVFQFSCLRRLALMSTPAASTPTKKAAPCGAALATCVGCEPDSNDGRASLLGNGPPATSAQPTCGDHVQNKHTGSDDNSRKSHLAPRSAATASHHRPHRLVRTEIVGAIDIEH